MSTAVGSAADGAARDTLGTAVPVLDRSPAIRTQGLTKSFGRQRAVDGLDLEVPAGSVFGFLGPNGSGKTTTIRMLLGLASPDAGEVAVLGEPVPTALLRVLPEVGAVIEGPAFSPWLSGRDNLRRYDAADRTAPVATRQARVSAALDRVGLGAAAGKRYKAYSLGMKQRLGIATALLRERRLLVLDEPTNGLDPQGTREVRSLVRSLSADGTTVFLSSHLLGEIEQVCSHVAVMSRGRLVMQGSVAELRGREHPTVIVDTPDVEQAATVLSGLGLAPPVTIAGTVRTALDGQPPEDVCAALVHAGVRVRAFGSELASLEDAYVALTGEGFDVAR